MKIMKFGGTSVGSVDSILKVKQIVEAEKEPVIVVVSALGGVTDQLIRTAAMATSGDIAYEAEFNSIVSRHEEMIKQIIPSGSQKRSLEKKIHALLDELRDIYQGLYLLKDISTKMEDMVVSYGERLSSLIVGTLIAEAEVFDSRAFMKTERKHHKHLLDSELSEQLICETFRELPRVSVVPGFIASDKDIIDYLKYNMRSQIYAKSLPMPIVEGCLKRLEIIDSAEGDELRAKLWEVTRTLQKGFRDLGFDIGPAEACVTPVLVKAGVNQASNIAVALREEYKIFCSVVIYPVIPPGMVIFRIIPTAAHSMEDVEYTLSAFRDIKERLDRGEFDKEMPNMAMFK